ncbi:MAG: MBL fold metallo-hydrolase [Patescibacteria group bacterium]|nr:MBL fold metallo-hydrolase [Patescibacteria group bacterium]
MAKLKILIQGYAKEIDGKEFASSSTVLINENNLNIVVDPGINRKELLKSLEKENLKVSDINFVILTHMHNDHSLLSGIFENAKILDNSDIISFDSNMYSHNGFIPNTNIKIIKTPGHDQFHASILVETEDLGSVVIAGDVFWWYDNEEQKIDLESLLNHKDPYVKNENQLKQSRKEILQIADYIIPGHGKIFKVIK